MFRTEPSCSPCLVTISTCALPSVGGYLEDLVFKAGAARDDAESWLSQLAEGSL